MYNRYMPQDKLMKKKNLFYNFYVRALIPWNLSCEAQGKTRNSVLEGLANGVAKKNTSVICLLVELFGVLAASIVGPSILMCAVKRSNRSFRNLIALGTSTLIFLLALIALYHAKLASVTSDEVSKTLENYSVVNGCSDSYTRVDVEGQFKSIIQSNSIVREDVLPCAYVLLIVASMNLALVTLIPAILRLKNSSYSLF